MCSDGLGLSTVVTTPFPAPAGVGLSPAPTLKEDAPGGLGPRFKQTLSAPLCGHAQGTLAEVLASL